MPSAAGAAIPDTTERIRMAENLHLPGQVVPDAAVDDLPCVRHVEVSLTAGVVNGIM